MSPYSEWKIDKKQPEKFPHPCLSVQEYTKELYKRGLNDLYNHNVSHLDSDILKCEVKWTLGSISMNKANEGDRIPLSYFNS